MATIMGWKCASGFINCGFPALFCNRAAVPGGLLRGNFFPTLQQHVKYRFSAFPTIQKKWITVLQQSTRFLHTTRRAAFRHNQKKRVSLIPSETAEGGEASVKMGELVKPFIFTVAFTAGSFTGAAIWQYENIRNTTFQAFSTPQQWLQNRLQQFPKQGTWRAYLNKWWNGLSEGQRIFIPICLLNFVVFLGWRVPALQPLMIRYFSSNPSSKSKCLPMILSTFSHYSALHLLANMYVLQSFSTGVVHILGKEQFLGLYLSAGVVSSFTSYLHKVRTAQPGMSLGASGSIMAVLAMVCTQYPGAELAIIFLPTMTFSAGIAIKVLMSVDAAGILFRWRFFDHAAHLGGTLFGMAWCYWGTKYIWQEREPFIQWWHKIRGPTRSD